jgi:hypothetical protein
MFITIVLLIYFTFWVIQLHSNSRQGIASFTSCRAVVRVSDYFTTILPQSSSCTLLFIYVTVAYMYFHFPILLEGSEPVFLNVYGVQESIPRNYFCQPM